MGVAKKAYRKTERNGEFCIITHTLSTAIRVKFK